ncbi:hypothetical protein [Archaeoglobus veneficus]|nr:hypothetical protein [Archaeoglobus veneficus]
MMCRNVPYLERVYRNVDAIRKREFKTFYDHLYSADCIIPVGEGRSQCALYIGLGRINKDVKMPDSIDFPGKNMFEAAKVLEKKYKRISLLVNSGSGETTTPKRIVRELSAYIEQTDSKKFTIDAIVSNPDSAIGRVGEKEYGAIIELRGRGREPKTAEEYMKHGIMNDIYELGSLMLIHRIKQAVNSGKSYRDVFRGIQNEFRRISKFVDDFVDSDIYDNLVEAMERRSHVIVGGLGMAKIVALMTVIRLQHVKRSIGDEVYLSGPLAPRPRAGDVLLLISWSGETEPLLSWCKEAKDFGAEVYSIVGRESTLSEKTNSFVMDCEVENFYCYAAFVLSPLPLSVVERLASRGLRLPEYIIGWYHSVTQ